MPTVNSWSGIWPPCKLVRVNKPLTHVIGGLSLIVVCYGGVKLWSLNVEHIQKKKDHDDRLKKAWKAVEDGRSMGAPPAHDPARGIEPKIVAAGKEQREGGDRLAVQETYLAIREEIKQYSTSPRQNDLFYTLGSYQGRGGFFEDAVYTADLITDAEKRIGLLIALGSHHVQNRRVGRDLLIRAGSEITHIENVARRDSLYAQLAFEQKTRGFLEDSQLSCQRILTPEYKTGTCH
jgi:hypothetical protein